LEQDIIDLGGAVLLMKYNFSPSQLLTSVFPDFEWLPWKFEKCPQNFWSDLKNQRKFLDWAAEKLKINEMSDWYKIQHKVNK
jgi:hypothetical protein